MNADNVEMSEIVIGAAMTVLNTLRPGLDEKRYERALVIELRKRGVHCEQQSPTRSSTKANSSESSCPT
jgi:GxxExxY protein